MFLPLLFMFSRKHEQNTGVSLLLVQNSYNNKSNTNKLWKTGMSVLHIQRGRKERA